MSNLNEIYKSVLEADRAAVVICDPEHVIIYMNPTAIRRYVSTSRSTSLRSVA